MTRFSRGDIGLQISIDREVESTLMSFTQRLSDSVESGGILFSALHGNPSVISIDYISGPSNWDIRRHNRYIPNGKRAQLSINSAFEAGYHYIGEWHTHSEKKPKPSAKDIQTIQDVFLRSKHELSYFILLIVGNSEAFSDSYVSIVDGHNVLTCECIDTL